MARTNRKAALAAAATSQPTNAKALDELNLDDMFNEGDDTLFDGIDIDLDGMGELAHNNNASHSDTNKRKTATSVPEAAPRKDLDAMRQETSDTSRRRSTNVNDASITDTAPPARRKTKRKIKAPPPIYESDDEDDYLQAGPAAAAPAPKRKRRATNASKASTKRTKTKAQKAASVPPPSFLTKKAMGTTGTTKRGALVRQASSSSTSFSASAATANSGNATMRRTTSSTASTGTVGPMEANIAASQSSSSSSWTIPSEATYCGIRPSNSDFYPFIDGIPPEPSIKKNLRTLPIISSVHTIISNTSPPPSAGSNNNDAKSNDTASESVKETEGIYKLLTADFNQMISDRNTSHAANDQRRANLGRSIATARTTVSEAEQRQLMSNLYSMCFMLKRQYDFLNQNMANMEQWCFENMAPQDYQAVYDDGDGRTMMAASNSRLLVAAAAANPSSTSSGGAASKQRGSAGAMTLPYEGQAQAVVAGTLLATLKSPIVKIRIRCAGFKAPKSGPLMAHVRLPGMALPSVLKNGDMATTKSGTTKKKKSAASAAASAESRGSLLSGALLAEDAPLAAREVSYADKKPCQRRQFVVDAVAKRAQSLEQQVSDLEERRKRMLEKQRADMQKVVDDDEILAVNTMTMWKWLEKAPHFGDYSEQDVKEVLDSIWEPEVTRQEMLIVPAAVASSQLVQTESQSSRREIPSADDRPSDSVFLRLQALLVDEGSADDDVDDLQDDDDDLLWMDDGIGSQMKVDCKANSSDDSATVLDLSGLSLEERTLLHLRAAGLVDAIPTSVTSSQPSLVEEDDGSSSILSSSKETSNDNGGRPSKTKTMEGQNDIDTVLLAMQADLAHQRRLNNARLGFLQMAAKSHIEAATQRRKREDENASLIVRYNQLLKKQKDAKKNGRNKPTKKDGDWVPW